jgi:hypothetical protein
LKEDRHAATHGVAKTPDEAGPLAAVEALG